MDAVEFLEEAHRMCDSFDDCEGCPGVAACLVNDTDWRKNPEVVVAAVEKFAAENPKVTRQAEFLLVHPEAVLDSDGILRVLPCMIDEQMYDGRFNGGCKVGCKLCRRKYWLAEMTKK